MNENESILWRQQAQSKNTLHLQQAAQCLKIIQKCLILLNMPYLSFLVKLIFDFF